MLLPVCYFALVNSISSSSTASSDSSMLFEDVILFLFQRLYLLDNKDWFSVFLDKVVSIHSPHQ